MTTKTKLHGWQWFLQLLFERFPYHLDSWVRKLDRVLFRTDRTHNRLRRLLQPSGHSIILPCLYLAMTYFVIVGPTYHMLGQHWLLPASIWVLSFALVVILGKIFPKRMYAVQLFGLILTVAAVSVAIRFIDGAFKESNNTLYTHIYLALAPIVMAIPIIARWGLHWLFRSLDKGQLQALFSKRIATVELFEDRGEKFKKDQLGITWDRFGNAFMLALFYNPILLLLLPSIWVLLTQERHDLPLHFGLGLGLSFLLLLYGRLRERWHMMVALVERAMTVGVPLIISIVVILFALGRLVDFSYVSIFLDGTRLTIWGYLLAFYVFAWMLEYWLNRFLNEKILLLLNANLQNGDYQFAYHFDGDNVLPVSNDALKRDRVLQIHGGSRFIVQSKDRRWFHSYNRMGLLERLLSIIGDQQAYIDSKKCLNIFARKIRIYFFTLNLLLIVAVWAFISEQTNTEVLPLYSGNPLPAADVSSDCNQLAGSTPGFRLDCALLNFVANHQDNRGDEQAAILFAASGGGTRAALHATSVLYGLHRNHLADNIVLLSGVSGGGVAAAYFSHQYRALMQQTGLEECPPSSRGLSYEDQEFDSYEAWRCYFEAMSHHYIKDVVEGMAEFRILGPESNGRLLQESIQSHFAAADHPAALPQTTFGQLQSHGLILNSTITGHQLAESDELSQRYADIDSDTAKNFYFTIFQGGRLALSNLRNIAGSQFVKFGQSNDLAFKYRAFNFPDMPLSTAAAMTANFPPVFSDARLCTSSSCDTNVTGQSTDYFLTDGGATHNQGLISLLLAAQQAVAELPSCTDGELHNLPRLHIVVAEASFANFDYSKGGRGLGAALSAVYGLGNGVIAQQLQDLQSDYDEKFKTCNKLTALEKPSVEVHMLSLPRLFRSRGGMGTHWMMPTDIKVGAPEYIDAKLAPRITLTRKQLKDYFVDIYSKHWEMCNNTDTADSDFQAFCKALKFSAAVPKGTQASPTCTAWLQLTSSLISGSNCREQHDLEGNKNL